MIPELGQLCLVLALMMSLLQAAVPLLARWSHPHSLLHLTKPIATGVFLLITAAFTALLVSFAVSDFSVLLVVLHSHSAKPLLYKIVGTWGNHEGSMLLWMWVLSASGFLVALTRAQDTQLKGITLAVLGALGAGLLAFILFTSNPFIRVFPSPLDGEDLNPILQDIGLAFHPPTLYVGYVGFGVAFAYAIAGLWLKRIDSNWARTVQPWILLPWSFLTLGIAGGSWWAYRELGWGGWWFWDPVENVSLLPWLTGTALLHSNRVLERRGQLARWVVLLAILTFTLSLIGTFIVRSGLITSVHAFASDPARGMFILAYIGVVSGLALWMYGARVNHIAANTSMQIISRNGFILINNLILVAAAAVVLFAILYPLALELLGLPAISIGPAYFNRTVLPLCAVLPVLCALAPLMGWDATSLHQLRRLCLTLGPSLLAAAIIGLALFSPLSALGMVGMALTAWLAYGSWYALRRLRTAQLRLTSSQGIRQIASIIAHFGFAIFILGMTTTGLMKQTYDLPLTPDAPMVAGAYTLELVGVERHAQHTYESRIARFDIRKNGQAITTLAPELRSYTVRGMQTSEAALYSTPWRDLYLVLGEANVAQGGKESRLGIRLYVTPGQQLIWIGFILAGVAGLLALFVAFSSRSPVKDSSCAVYPS